MKLGDNQFRILNSKFMIKAILFDLDGTLRHHLPSGGEFFTDYAISLGLPLGPEDRLRAARWEHYYFANSPEIKADSALFTEEEKFWVTFGRRRLIVLGCSPAQAAELSPQFSAHMRENRRPEVHVPEDARTLLATLKEAGYILGVVSNREKPYQEQLEEMGLSQHFTFTLAGGEVQSFKPDRVIFDEALRRAGTSAPETMYVGDNYFADVVGSRRAGLRPVLYDPIGLFPDAECAVIQSFDQLPQLLK
jgi:FMN phosphatase YigB (HAD superfamily)